MADCSTVEFVGHRNAEAEAYILETALQQQQAAVSGEEPHSSQLDEVLAVMNGVMGKIAAEAGADLSNRLPPVGAYRFFATQDKLNVGLGQFSLPPTQGQGYCDGINMFVRDEAESGAPFELGVAAHELGHFVAKHRIELVDSGTALSVTMRTNGLLIPNDAADTTRRRMIDESLADLLKIDQMNRWRTTDELEAIGVVPDQASLSYPGAYVLGSLMSKVAETNAADPYAMYQGLLAGHLNGEDGVLLDIKESLPATLHEAYDALQGAGPNSFASSIAASEALGLGDARQALLSYSDMFVKTPSVFEWLDRS